MARSPDNQRKLLRSRLELLSKIQKEPEKYFSNDIVMRFLGSQGGFASIEWREFEIESVSLNSLKLYARKHLPGGFEMLDQARKLALDGYRNYEEKSQETYGSGTKRHLQKRLVELRAEVAMSREELVLLTLCLKRSLRLWRSFVDAHGSKVEVDRCSKEQAEILSCFSHGTRISDQVDMLNNVIKL